MKGNLSAGSASPSGPTIEAVDSAVVVTSAMVVWEGERMACHVMCSASSADGRWQLLESVAIC